MRWNSLSLITEFASSGGHSTNTESGSIIRSSTATTIIASEGFRQSGIKFTGHCRREFSMYRYPGLFVGLPRQYLLLQLFYWASWEYTRKGMPRMCWANDRTQL
ncbi:hypothetical protein FJTKL_14010 [Diaporthe vaccinii]|uniref:Uncharacterized protein n=1 Tax=Diaporthe vaccinii TaxID=105482 RepID=A0ABR4E9F5_9PEZI